MLHKTRRAIEDYAKPDRDFLMLAREGQVGIDIDADRLTIRTGTGNAAGHGIGLSIVKRLCDRFGWEIEVATRARRGASFRLNCAPRRLAWPERAV